MTSDDFVDAEELLESGRPLALVAEDNINLRENTVRMLDRRGIAAIPVGSYQQAANVLRVSPHVDVALLDIHLIPDKDAENKGGIEVARLLRSSTSSVRIIGYSGKFRAEELSVDELRLFDETRAKGSLSGEDHLELWNLAAEYAKLSHATRRDAIHENLAQLRRLYEMEVPKVEVIRRVEIGSPPDSQDTAEGALGLAGYKVRMVQLEKNDVRSSSVVVWYQRVNVGHENTWSNIEVYEYPELYASGETEAEALQALAEYMELTAEDLGSQASLSPDEARLRNFLSGLWR